MGKYHKPTSWFRDAALTGLSQTDGNVRFIQNLPQEQGIIRQHLEAAIHLKWTGKVRGRGGGAANHPMEGIIHITHGQAEEDGPISHTQP